MVDYRKNGGVRANAQCQSQHGDKGKAGALKEDANGMADVCQ
jgi:hypothetical protein